MIKFKHFMLGLHLMCYTVISLAQNRVDMPYYFCAMNGTCFNLPPNGWVRSENEEFDPEDIIDITNEFITNHPDFTVLDSASKLYNCHGYAYSVYQGGEKLIIQWKESLCSFNGGVAPSYIQINENQIQPGDVATIINPDDNGAYSIHSSIVVNEDTLISKFYETPLFKHHKYAPWIVQATNLGNNGIHYVYYRRVINTSAQIAGPNIIDGSGTYTFTPNVTPTACSWSVEPAAMFQNATGTGNTANLSYATPFVHLAPKATLTFTFSYGCDNHYTATKEIDLLIPTTTISGFAVSDGFVLDTNAVVTVTGGIRSNYKAKTIVPIGTTLILNGGKMTSNGNYLWQGIEVWGNSSMHQFAVNGSHYQGYLELKNGAVIENAEMAVTLWRPDYYSTTGGIVHATDATFLNNAMAFRAVWYHNYHPATLIEQSYNSYFENCDFIVDSNYLGTVTCHRHVDLAYVKGISFLGCRFSVIRQTPGVSYSCIGILANQASFTVNAYCPQGHYFLPCPDENLVRSSFYGFHTGVYAANDGNSARTFLVRDSDFLNNGRGIYALNTGYATILKNNFSVGCGSDCDFGIYAERVTGFYIEENSFAPWHKTGCSAFGIAIDNSQGVNDVYLNDFSNLTCANLAFGENTSVTNPTNPTFDKGLTYSCNNNTHESSNMIDFCVVHDASANYSGIQQMQGSPSMPAGNTFGGTLYHFYNDGNYVVDYFYNQNQTDQVPDSTKVFKVTRNGINSVNLCVSHYDDRVVLSGEEKTSRESDYLSAHYAYNSLKQIYDSRIDGGNTPAELADITNATPSDMWQLRAQLLGHSPYLSQEVLTTAADRDDVFTNSVLFEILSANPDELKKDTLISYLESKDNPLPDYMINLLRQIANGATARTALEAEMAKYSHDFRLAAGDIVRSNLNDSVSNPTELRTWLAAMEDIAADRLIVASYMEERNYTDAFTLANMLPDLYGLEGDGLADHTDYMRLLDLYRTLGTTGRTVFEMTEEETEMVEGIADYGKGTSQAMAEALLSGVMDNRISYKSCPDIPTVKEGERSIGNYTSVLANEAVGFNVNVSPSPATTWTTVDYTLPAGATKATMTLNSTMGVKVMEVELYGNQGSKVLDLRGLAAGVYVYSIRCGEYVQPGKLVITN